ncbi:MAG: hypothetical protein ABSE39_04730 [Candidatus Bathyarchaeia archaeon]|jgi:hypothetical protein
MGILQKLSGAITRADYNNLVAFLGGNSSNTSLFDTDLAMNNPSTGLIVKTPDSTKRYRIRVDNSGNIVTELT